MRFALLAVALAAIYGSHCVVTVAVDPDPSILQQNDQKSDKTESLPNNEPESVPDVKPALRIDTSPFNKRHRALECIACSDCPHVTRYNATVKACPYTYDSHKNQKCVVYAEKYNHLQKPWVVRGCASERGSCGDIKRVHEAHLELVDIIYCSECEGDRCNTNGVSRSTPEAIMAAIVLILTPLLFKATLS